MPLSRPSLTIFAWSPSTCARGVPAFRGACDKRRTREVCHNGVEAGVARDRDLRAVDSVGDCDTVGGERAVNHVTLVVLNGEEGREDHGRADSNDIRAGFAAPVQFARGRGRGRGLGRDELEYGRGSRTMICALPGSLTVISVVADRTCARGRRRDRRRLRAQGARSNSDGAVREIGARGRTARRRARGRRKASSRVARNYRRTRVTVPVSGFPWL